MQRWCTAEDVELVAVYEDLGVSGATPVAGRPGLLDALAALGEHGADMLLASRRDRIARDMFVTIMIEKLAGERGAVVRAADGAGNGDGPEAQLMRRMLDAFYEFELAKIRMRTREALAVKKSRGERTGGVPYGQRLAADGVHLEPDAGEQEKIRVARELRAGGLSLRAVGRALAGKGMFPRTGHRWHHKTIKAMLAAEAA